MLFNYHSSYVGETKEENKIKKEKRKSRLTIGQQGMKKHAYTRAGFSEHRYMYMYIRGFILPIGMQHHYICCVVLSVVLLVYMSEYMCI